MPSVLNDPKVEGLLARLHEASAAQMPAMTDYFTERFSRGGPVDFGEGEVKAYLGDKLVALEQEKAEFCYLLCRSLKARTVVEAGTSHGVSTLYLACAVRDNFPREVGGKVIATEYEPDKARVARANFAEAGLSGFIDLREGDLRETLAGLTEPVDFMLIDIWTDMARPALELVAPALRPGALVVCDNTAAFRDAYADYFAFIAERGSEFRTMTLPFEGGLELTLRC